MQVGDTDSNNYVDQTDLDWVTNNWLEPGDVTGSTDGIVNLEDLNLVLNNWLQGNIQVGPKLRNTLETKIEMAMNHSNTLGC